MKESNSSNEKNLHYKLTKDYFSEIAERKKGFYDAKNIDELTHSSSQKKFWKLVISILNKIMKDKEDEFLKIVDVGCGIGDFTVDLAKKFPQFKKIVGVDFLDEVIKIAEKNSNNFDKVKFVKEDLLKLSFENRAFDISLCINVIHHIYKSDFEKALKELSRITDKYLIFEIRNKKNIFNFWYKYFILPVFFKNLKIFSYSIGEVNEILKNEDFKLEMAKGIYSRTWICRRLLLVYKRIKK